jgi:hypothetical protein
MSMFFYVADMKKRDGRRIVDFPQLWRVDGETTDPLWRVMTSRCRVPPGARCWPMSLLNCLVPQGWYWHWSHADELLCIYSFSQISLCVWLLSHKRWVRDLRDLKSRGTSGCVSPSREVPGPVSLVWWDVRGRPAVMQSEFPWISDDLKWTYPVQRDHTPHHFSVKSVPTCVNTRDLLHWSFIAGWMASSASLSLWNLR